MEQPRYAITLLALPSGDYYMECVDYLQRLSPNSAMEKFLNIDKHLPVTLTRSASAEKAESITKALSRMGARVEKRPVTLDSRSSSPDTSQDSHWSSWFSRLRRHQEAR